MREVCKEKMAMELGLKRTLVLRSGLEFNLLKLNKYSPLTNNTYLWLNHDINQATKLPEGSNHRNLYYRYIV